MTYCVSGSRSNQLSYISILWTERDSNPRRLALQANALPTELSVHFFVGAEGFEPPIHADYRIYSPAPNQLEHYSHFVPPAGLEPATSCM